MWKCQAPIQGEDIAQYESRILDKYRRLVRDGDIMNIFRIIGEDMAKRFSKNLNPKYNLFVSRMDGLVNKECLPMKDSIVGFWAFNNI